MKRIFRFVVSVLLPLLTGFAGSVFTRMSVSTWYREINKPAFNPPDWIFAPVWTALFILIGVSFYIVWESSFGEYKKSLIFLYFGQLFFNFLWSVLFFGLRNPVLAFIDLFILYVLVVFLINGFFRVSKSAGVLLVPYILWLSFAAVLNFSIIVINF